MLLRVLFSLLIFHLSTAATDDQADLQYLLTVPSVLHSRLPNTACVHLLQVNESVNLNVVLEYEGRNVTILTESLRGQTFFKCTNFVVPQAGSNPLAFIIISLKGLTVNRSERRMVAIQNKGSVGFVQTDKPIYKPGQKVLFRVVSLDTNFKPVPETYPLITVQDPQNNRIFQWTNVTSVVEESFHLISEPILGSYQITVEKTSGDKIYHSFSVEEYVLPKFEVTLKAPKTVSVANRNFTVKVCGVYTYGQPVEGKAKLTVCRNLNFYGSCKLDPVCESVNQDLGKDGCLSHVFDSRTFELNRSGYGMTLDIKAAITEKGTGVQIEQSAYISVSRVVGSVLFENMDEDYRRGIPYCGQIKLVDVEDSPIGNDVVQLLLDNKNVGNYTTSENGTAQFCIDTSDLLNPSYGLKLIYKANGNCNSDVWLFPYYPEAYYSINRFYSRTNSFVKIQKAWDELPCGQFRSIKVSYILNKKGYKNSPTAVFYYIVLVKNKIVQYGHQDVDLTRASSGSFSFQLAGRPEVAPVATVVVYTLHPERELVGDVAQFKIEKCFKNKVRLQFSEKQTLPGSNVKLSIEAAANSQCALRAVDQSVLLLRPERELSPDSMYNLLPGDMFGYYFNGLNLEDDPKVPCTPPDNIFYNGLYYVPDNVNYGQDIFGLIRNTGVKFVTNSRLQKPVICASAPRFSPGLEFSDSVSRFPMTTAIGGAFSVPSPPNRFAKETIENVIVETVRKFFPETWIWDLIPVGATGKAQHSYVVPDTITEWKANAFCLDRETGFGLSQPVSLVAFQPFFVEPTLPYSIVRGEDFLLRANVFNYLDRCIQVIVTLAQSQAFQARLVSPVGDDGCVCGGERKTYVWNIVSKKLGDVEFSITAEAPQNSRVCRNGTGGLDVRRKDTLIRTLLVEPEGVEREATQSSLICTKGAPVSEPVSLKLPENLVEGSARASFSCIGDLMGTAMQNLQQLLRMPYGCGEQNMVLFTPNIYILDYLNATGQLTDETKSKAIGYLVNGYQRQLAYKHSDGSYSAFGNSDQEGNTWLTAFVYKSFARAVKYIFIDSNVQTQSFFWLSSKQKSDGCFQNVGKLFNNALKGGLQDDLSLSAYVTSALLESGFPASHPVVRNALYCLETGLAKETVSVYDQALLAYTFGLAGNQQKLDFLLDKLSKSAKKVGGSLHWERDDKPPAEQYPSFYSRAPSAEVEMTSYVLLAYLAKRNPTAEQITTASRIVQWIAKQQNPYGGFSTTQDTVVALQALARYSQLTFSKDGQNIVKIRSKKPFEKMFQVNNNNRLLLQQTSLPDVPGSYVVEMSGNGCVFVQTTLRYNVILPRKSSGFFLSVQTANASCESDFQATFSIAITTRYVGKRNSSNMALVDVKLLTGFIPDQSSLQKLLNANVVKKVETKQSHVLFYLDSLSRNDTSFSFKVVQDLPVSNLKPASVRVYDYYETDEVGVAEYKNPCDKNGS